MNTPICDFVEAYRKKNPIRLHMPGHKGVGGMEALDITEIFGADDLYAPCGIVAESEKNASSLFGARTIYSVEGASQCIRAMVFLSVVYANATGHTPHILAARNAHRAFSSAAALTGCAVSWLYGPDSDYLSCTLSPEKIDEALATGVYTALYITSPDYLGHIADIAAISAVCKKRGVLLLVDNAHGAYLRFLKPDLHPLSLGADLVCDSAHKTLPVLTGGAYLHLQNALPPFVQEAAKRAMALFGSSSPSYLLLQSLDRANALLADNYPHRLASIAVSLSALKTRLLCAGFSLVGTEPLKLTLATKPYGYTGKAVAAYLHRQNIVCEFSDPDFVVFMLTPAVPENALPLLESALLALPKRPPLSDAMPPLSKPETVMDIRTAAFSPSVCVPSAAAVGRILALDTIACPPAVPIAVCGERISEEAVAAFSYYGIRSCHVVAEETSHL